MQNEPMNQNNKGTNLSDPTAEGTNRNADVSGTQKNMQVPPSSESLADSEMSVGQGAVTGEKGTEENKEANPLVMGHNPDRERLSGNRSN